MSFFFKKKIPKFPFPNTKKKYKVFFNSINKNNWDQLRWKNWNEKMVTNAEWAGGFRDNYDRMVLNKRKQVFVSIFYICWVWCSEGYCGSWLHYCRNTTVSAVVVVEVRKDSSTYDREMYTKKRLCAETVLPSRNSLISTKLISCWKYGYFQENIPI